jgi:hypothetical protein
VALLTGALAILHVIFAMNFLGSVFILNLVMGPVVLKLSPATLNEFFAKFWPSMARFLHGSIGGTAIFGLLLYGVGGFGSLSGNSAIFLDAGILLALIAMIEAEAVQIPTVNKIVKLGQGSGAGMQSLSQEQLKLFNKVKVGGILGVLLMAVVVMLMVAAAFV